MLAHDGLHAPEVPHESNWARVTSNEMPVTSSNPGYIVTKLGPVGRSRPNVQTVALRLGRPRRRGRASPHSGLAAAEPTPSSGASWHARQYLEVELVHDVDPRVGYGLGLGPFRPALAAGTNVAWGDPSMTGTRRRLRDRSLPDGRWSRCGTGTPATKRPSNESRNAMSRRGLQDGRRQR